MTAGFGKTSGQRSQKHRRIGLGVSALAICAAGAAIAEVPSHNLYGLPGMIDMPTAEMSPDATLSATLGGFRDNSRTTLSFQITPRLVGSFRYSAIRNFDNPASVDGVFFDRSFDLRYQLLTETDLRPAVAIGLQDFIGTGLYGGEYIVATKNITPQIQVTGGIGWGRFGGVGEFGSTGTRPDIDDLLGEGGVPTYDRWFRGDVAAFGGISWAPTDRLRFTAEYSSDDYDLEERDGDFDRKSPWNFGIDYRFDSGLQLSLYHVYGTETGAQVTLFTNPKTAGVPGGVETAPVPVSVRDPGAAADLGWTADTARQARNRQALDEALAREGLSADGVRIEPTRATVRLRNPRYGAAPQAIGRTTRIMTRVLPASIETFVIVPTENGMPLSAVTLRRSDLEALENEAAAEMLVRAEIGEGFGRAPAVDPGLYPKFTWSLGPYVKVSAFDPEAPIRADTGIRARAAWRIRPDFVLSGSVTKKAAGNLDEIEREDESDLPRVRTDYAEYSAEGDPAIEHLTFAHFGRPAPDFYSRVTVGYLEPMYAGASAEILWKPVNSRLALGAELNYVQRRDFDQLFGLQDMTTTDPVDGEEREIPNVNGHVSAYYDFGNGFHGQLDVGRYLAGDLGATISLDREFNNGWRVGAYATFTDASFEDFGEGSFDKGIRVTVPLSVAVGEPSRRRNTFTISSLTRDGGARLNVNDRLYQQIRDYHEPDLAKTWGRFWR